MHKQQKKDFCFNACIYVLMIVSINENNPHLQNMIIASYCNNM